MPKSVPNNLQSNNSTEQKSPVGFNVKASPFNAVKLEVGIILVFSVMYWVVVEAMPINDGMQIILLLAYGLLSLSWVIFRTKRVLQRAAAKSNSHN